MHTDSRLKKLVIVFTIIAGYFLLIFYPHFLSDDSFCLFKYITGIPCPACGSTRATVLLFNGEFLKSVLMNPFALITNFLIILSLLWLINDLVKDKNDYFIFMKRDWQLNYKIIFVVVVIANWIWNIKKGL